MDSQDNMRGGPGRPMNIIIDPADMVLALNLLMLLGQVLAYFLYFRHESVKNVKLRNSNILLTQSVGSLVKTLYKVLDQNPELPEQEDPKIEL